jgi:hypothetical protein
MIVLIRVQVVQEYERAVIFRLGRLLQRGAKGPGILSEFKHRLLNCYNSQNAASVGNEASLMLIKRRLEAKPRIAQNVC